MAELIGIASGVIGIVLPAIDQIEKLVDRCQNFRAAPADFRNLKSDCKAVSDSLHSLETKLQNLQKNATIAPEDIQRFKSDAHSVRKNFERAQEKCRKVEKYFPPPQSDSPSCRGSLSHSRRALFRFPRAGIIARECEDISRIVRDANKDGTAFNRFLHITIHIEGVKNAVGQVGARVEQVEVGVTTANEKLDTLVQRSEEGATDANDNFEPKYYVPDLSSNIILDFSTCDAEDVPVTMEGKLKRALLDIGSHSEFSRVAAAVGAGGMGGVGKTNALKGLGWEEDIRKMFQHGGIYFLRFGKDAGVGDVIEQLALAVGVSGGAGQAREIRGSKTLRGAIEIVVNWFQKRETLFLCDDMWETAKSRDGYLNELKQLLTSRGRSRMVLSTRDQKIADAAGTPVKFGPRDSEGDLSRAILLKYANISAEDLIDSCEKCQEAIGNILRICGGIPLTLGVAGRAVKNRDCDLQTAVVMYAKELETSTREIMTEDIEGYPNFCATVRTSLDMVDGWAQEERIFGERGEALVCSDLFTRMNVFPRKSRIPERAVKKLWGDVNDYDADRIINKLVDLNLLSKGKYMKNRGSVGLHDLVLEYCLIQARRDPRSFHFDFMGEYLTASKHLTAESATVGDSALDKLLTTLESRAWWSLSSDGYFPENVCRHLWKGGCVIELIALLCDVRWTAFRMRCGGLLEWKNDFESFTSAVSEVKKESENADGWKMVEGGLELVREAVNEAWGYLKGNKRELGMQVHSRLFDVEAEVWPVSRYLRSVRAHCEKPWLVPLGRYWPRPGTGASVELLVGVDVKSIAMTNDGSVVAVAVGEEVLAIYVESKSILWRQAGHEEDVSCVCISEDGAMVVSGSGDGTLRRWDGRNGMPLGEPLRGHDDWVNCVAMSRDGAILVSGSRDGTLRRWDGRTGAAVGDPLRAHDDGVRCVAISADGAIIVSGSLDGTLHRWDGRSWAAIGEPQRGYHGCVHCVAISGDGAMIVSGSQDGTLRRWYARTGAAMGEPLRGHKDVVRCVAISGDGAMIVSGSQDETLCRWDARTGAAIGERQLGHHGWVRCVAISSDRTTIVSGANDGTLCRWDGRTGSVTNKPMRGLDGWVHCVVMSGNGTMIVFASDETVQMWDARTGTTIGPPVLGPNLKSIEIENDFVLTYDYEKIQWRIDKTCGLVDNEEWELSTRWSEGAGRSGGSDVPSPWEVRVSRHQLVWDGPTGVHVLATLLSDVAKLTYKRVSFRAGGIGDDDGESSYAVGAVIIVQLRNRMVCIFHLMTE